MTRRLVICAGLLGPLAGCSLVQTTARNLHNEPQLAVQDHNLEHRLRSSARAALAECAGRHPRKVFTHEFRDGFVDGFADYLDNGGPCNPPAVPPFKYRKTEYLTPEGHAKIRDYFLGFKYGIDVAVASGWRTYLTVPVLIADRGPPPPLNITILPTPPDGLSTDPPAATAPPTAAPKAAPLPSPRPVDPPPTPAPAIPLPKVGSPPDGGLPPPVVPIPEPKKTDSNPKPPESAAPRPSTGVESVALPGQPPTGSIPAPVPIPLTIAPPPGGGPPVVAPPAPPAGTPVSTPR